MALILKAGRKGVEYLSTGRVAPMRVDASGNYIVC